MSFRQDLPNPPVTPKRTADFTDEFDKLTQVNGCENLAEMDF